MKGYIIENPNDHAFVYEEGKREYHGEMCFSVFDDIRSLLQCRLYYYESLSQDGYPYEGSHLCEVQYEKEETDYRIAEFRRVRDLTVLRVLTIPQIIAALGAKTLPVHRFPRQEAFADADGNVGDWYDGGAFAVWEGLIIMRKEGRYVLVYADTGRPVDGKLYDQIYPSKDSDGLTLRLGDMRTYINHE